MKDKLLVSINFIHLQLFGHPMGSEMQKFIRNLGWVGSGTVISIVLIFIVNTLAARLLGPTEYGKYSLIVSLGLIFIIPMTIGVNTAVVKYISSSKTQKRKNLFAQNTIFLTTISIIVTFAVYLTFNRQLSNLLKIDKQIFIFLSIYTVVLGVKYISEAIIKGFHQFRLISFLEVINAVVIFLSFLICILINKKYTFTTYLIPTIIGLLSYSAYTYVKNRHKFKTFKPNKLIMMKLLNYGKFAVLGGISGITLNNIDKLVINRYMSLADIGTYSIYLGSSTFIGGYILQIFTQVFFPTVSAIKEKKAIVNKIKKLMLVTALPIIITNILSTSFILFLIGNQYEKNISYILLFSFLGMLTVFSGILWWFIASFGKKGIKFTSITGIIIGAANIVIMTCLAQKLGIFGIITSLTISNTFMIIIATIKINHLAYEK